jgi:hypothetical protein
MTNEAQQDLPHSPLILQANAQAHDMRLDALATAAQPGSVRSGTLSNSPDPLQYFREKGAVEGEAGQLRHHRGARPRRHHPAELNAHIDAWAQQGDQRRISECPRTVAEYFAIEKPLLQPLP